MFTDSRLQQCPHRTATMLNKLLPGTLTCNTKTIKLGINKNRCVELQEHKNVVLIDQKHQLWPRCCTISGSSFMKVKHTDGRASIWRDEEIRQEEAIGGEPEIHAWRRQINNIGKKSSCRRRVAHQQKMMGRSLLCFLDRDGSTFGIYFFFCLWIWSFFSDVYF